MNSPFSTAMLNNQRVHDTNKHLHRAQMVKMVTVNYRYRIRTDMSISTFLIIMVIYVHTRIYVHVHQWCKNPRSQMLNYNILIIRKRTGQFGSTGHLVVSHQYHMTSSYANGRSEPPTSKWPKLGGTNHPQMVGYGIGFPTLQNPIQLDYSLVIKHGNGKSPID